MTPRYVVEWTIFPRNPWVVRDMVKGNAVATNGRHFNHYGTPEQAQRLADKLNAKELRLWTT